MGKSAPSRASRAQDGGEMSMRRSLLGKAAGGRCAYMVSLSAQHTAGAYDRLEDMR